MKKLLVIVLLMLVTACGPQISEPPTDEATQAPPTQAATVTPMPTVTPRPTATQRPPTPTDAPEFGDRSKPIPVGEAGSLWVQRSGAERIDFTFTVLSVLRGEEAWQVVHGANMFNEPAPEGLHYVIVEIEVVYSGADHGVLELEDDDFTIVTSGQIVDYFDDPTLFDACCVEPTLPISMFSGGEGRALLVRSVRDTDPAPMLVLFFDAQTAGGVYFSLTP
jgi:hypothetical protein